MKILILANDDLTSNLIFSKLFDVDGVDILGVAFTETYTKGKSGYSGAISLLKVLDFKYWIFLVFVVLGFKIKEIVSKILRTHASLSLKLQAIKNGVPILYSSDFNSDDFINTVTSLKPDLVVIRIDQILKEKFLSIPKHGVFCVHSSLLPAYKGIAGEFHAINNNENVIGTTIFQVKAQLDAGEVLSQVWFDIEKGRSLFHQIVKNNISGGELLHKMVVSLKNEGKINGDFYPGVLKSSYYSWPSKADVKKYKKHGGKMLGIKGIIGYVEWVFCDARNIKDIV